MALLRTASLAVLWNCVASRTYADAAAAHAQVVVQNPAAASAAAAAAAAATPRQLSGRFLHITDFHPDEFYRVHTSTASGDACHDGTGPAGTYGAETSDCDSPLSLVNATFDWIRGNLKDSVDFVVWTGDSARHDSDEERPRTEAQVLAMNRLLAHKFLEVFGDSTGRALSVPVIPTFGNNDILPHNILLPGPNRWFTAYADIWKHFIPEEQRHGFSFGGWFYVEVIPNRLAVFSLNTLFLFDRNAGVDGCAKPSEPGYKQMEWLRVQLQALRRRGVKAIITGHVPPARTGSKKLWDETCWQKYTLWLQQFRDVVVVGLYGHMNIDHFMLHDTKELDLFTASGEDTVDIREAMGDELTLQSATDYLQELRQGWSKLPLPPPKTTASGKHEHGKAETRGKKRKPKHMGPWAERYQLSLVSPSIVPNYFPTLRVIEYNISGLENSPVWTPSTGSMPATEVDEYARLDLRAVADDEAGTEADTDKHKKHKKNKKPKKPIHEPKDPNLVIPNPPSKSAPPGPAYSLQPLSLLGYTQYFANLTHINNLTLQDGPDTSAEPDSPSSSSWDWLLRWRSGKHGGKEPKDARPSPREFAFEVEYNTFTDKLYELGDMTVSSFVKLAFRMAQQGQVQGNGVAGSGGQQHDAYGHVDDDEADDEADDEDEEEGHMATTTLKKRYNKTWVHFLEHAFIKTVSRKELKKMA